MCGIYLEPKWGSVDPFEIRVEASRLESDLITMEEIDAGTITAQRPSKPRPAIQPTDPSLGSFAPKPPRRPPTVPPPAPPRKHPPPPPWTCKYCGVRNLDVRLTCKGCGAQR